MRVQSLLPLLLIAALTGCGGWLEPPEMQNPIGPQTAIPPQDTPALEARAAKEREDLPAVPAPPDPETYSYLGSVPPKPVMPTPEEIAGQVKALAGEQANGAALIDQQSDEPDIQTLPKAAAKSAKGAAPGVVTPSDDQVFSGNPNAFLPQSQLQTTDRLPADAP